LEGVLGEKYVFSSAHMYALDANNSSHSDRILGSRVLQMEINANAPSKVLKSRGFITLFSLFNGP